MKFVLILTCFMTLFIVSEPSFTNIERNIVLEPVKQIDYYNFTRDTSLQKFPPIYAPQCITEKRHIIDPMPSNVEILMVAGIISTFVYL